jgi:hypothetical protein
MRERVISSQHMREKNVITFDGLRHDTPYVFRVVAAAFAGGGGAAATAASPHSATVYTTPLPTTEPTAAAGR